MVLKIQRVHLEETDAQDLGEMFDRPRIKIRKVVPKRMAIVHLQDEEDQGTIDQDLKRKVVKPTRTEK
jgi:hypothetical protein